MRSKELLYRLRYTLKKYIIIRILHRSYSHIRNQNRSYSTILKFVKLLELTMKVKISVSQRIAFESSRIFESLCRCGCGCDSVLTKSPLRRKCNLIINAIGKILHICMRLRSRASLG